MKNKRKLRLAALLAVLLLLFPAFAVEDDITDESDTSTTQTEETDQTAQLGGTDSIDPSADKPRVFDYEEVLTQTQIDTLEEKTKAIAEKYSIGVGIITIDDYTPYGDGAYDAAEQLYNELDLGASEDGDGVALCREIKQEYDVPILFLTAMGENEDIVKGLTAGGDDYLTKPYDLEVFMARVEARLRAAHPKERAVRLGTLQMNLLSGRAYIGETDLNLTQKKFAALLYLARHPNRSVSAQELYEAVWQQPMGADPHAVRMTISRLKQKLGGEDARVTVNSYRSSGYRLEEQ